MSVMLQREALTLAPDLVRKIKKLWILGGSAGTRSASACRASGDGERRVYVVKRWRCWRTSA